MKTEALKKEKNLLFSLSQLLYKEQSYDNKPILLSTIKI
jgi:hypothetical protein